MEKLNWQKEKQTRVCRRNKGFKLLLFLTAQIENDWYPPQESLWGVFT